MKRNDLVGHVFNRLTVVGISRLCARQNVLWTCRCICGGTAEAFAYDLRNGKVKSCGCLTKEGLHRTHGMSKTAIYKVWASMVQRCTNPADRNYGNYGARDIGVCKRWLKFENFYADMGDCPVGKSLERKNNSRMYTPNNCTWATVSEQQRNKRSNVWVYIAGKKMILQDALVYIGYSRAAMHHQMRTYVLTHQEVLDKWLQKSTR